MVFEQLDNVFVDNEKHISTLMNQTHWNPTKNRVLQPVHIRFNQVGETMEENKTCQKIKSIQIMTEEHLSSTRKHRFDLILLFI